MNKPTAALAALALAACNAQNDPAQQYRDALPTAQKVQIGTPQATAGVSGALTARSAAIGPAAVKSQYAVDSYYLALSVNGGVAWTLTTVRWITLQKPTSCGDTSCTWGPWIDDQGLNRWELTVVKNGAAYDWALSAQPGSKPAAAFVALISGTANPVDALHGHGTFTVDFDAQTALDHGPLWQQQDFGTLAVTYDDRTALSVGATFLGAHNQDPANPCVMNAAYAFDAAAAGGQLQIAFENLTTNGVMSLRTRWGADGAGRGDAHYVGPDGLGNPVDYHASECWAGKTAGFAMDYDTQSSDPSLLNESVCEPFVPAQYADIALPQ